jgi:hypothetical protein
MKKITYKFVNDNIETFLKVAYEAFPTDSCFDEIEVAGYNEKQPQHITLRFINNMGGMRFVSYYNFTSIMMNRVYRHLRKQKLERILKVEIC